MTTSLAWQVISIELRRAFTYRFEFWFKFLGTLFANVGLAYFLWEAIYAQTGVREIEGYTFPAMVLYYVLVPLTQNLTRGHEPHSVSTEIYSGTLTRYLIFPMPFFLYKYAANVASILVAIVQMALVLVVYALVAGIPPEVALSPQSMALGLVAAVVASLLNFYLVTTIEMVTFWADHIWSLNVMLMFVIRLFGGSMLPLALFPQAVQQVLPYTPFPYLVSFPILTFMGRVSLQDWVQGMGILMLWIVVSGLVHRLVWRRGIHQYSGVGI